MIQTGRPNAADSPLCLDERPLSDLAPRVLFYKGTEIGAQGEPCTHLHIIAEGQVLLSRRDARGGKYALYLLGPGDLFGEGSLLPEGRWLMSARAVTRGAMHLLPAVHLPRLGQFYPQLTAHIVRELSARLERAHRRRDLMAQPGARERLIGLLLTLAEYHGSSKGSEAWVPMTLTQADLAGMIGVARETVARLLSDLQLEGAVRREGRRGLWLRLT